MTTRKRRTAAVPTTAGCARARSRCTRAARRRSGRRRGGLPPSGNRSAPFVGCAASTDLHSAVAPAATRRRHRMRRRRRPCSSSATTAAPSAAAAAACGGSALREPSKGRTLYHQRGARLGAMLRSEALAAALGPRAVARVSQMNSARGYREGWAAAFAAAGFAPGGVAQLLRGPAKAGQRNFTGAMREHLGGRQVR